LRTLNCTPGTQVYFSRFGCVLTMASLHCIMIRTLFGALTTLPVLPFAMAVPLPNPIPVSLPAASAESPTRVGAVWSDHWYEGKHQVLELGCNFLISTKGLAGHVSSYVVLPGYQCWFYEDKHCFGEELFTAKSREDATLKDYDDNKMASVACNYAS